MTDKLWLWLLNVYRIGIYENFYNYIFSEGKKIEKMYSDGDDQFEVQTVCPKSLVHIYIATSFMTERDFLGIQYNIHSLVL